MITMMMPSKIRKALGAVKDQTSISLAKVTNAANLEVTVLKATTHDEIPIEERYIYEIIHLVSSSKVFAASCAQSIGRRIGKTKNWVVVLKSLMLVLRIFQDGDPYFPREVFLAMKRGAKILNLSGFRDDSSWDYTAFVRTIALYLDERLDCFLTGKLQRRVTTLKNFNKQKNTKMLINETGIKEMKPTMLLDRISYWQRLLDRAMGTKPNGEAKTNRLVQISLYAIVQETFDLYRDISDGLAVILDNFFKLPCKAGISAFQACVKSYKQFDELSNFYSFCMSIGVGRTSEYPTVQKVSEELMEALQEYLRDQATNIDNNNAQSPLSQHLLVSALRESVGLSNFKSRQDETYERYGTPERYFEAVSEYGSICTSLEDLMSATDHDQTPTRSLDMDYYEQDERQSHNNDDISSAYESCSNHSNTIDQTSRSSMEMVNMSLDEFQQQAGEKQRNNNNISELGSNDCWELVLVETTTTTTTPEKTLPNNFLNRFESSLDSNLFDQTPFSQQNQYNPFLELEDIATIPPPTTMDQNQANFIDYFEDAPTFHVANVGVEPTFCARRDSSEATLTAPTFTTQCSNSESDLDLIFGDLYSNSKSAMPTTVQSKDMILAPSVQSQGSFEISPTSSFQGHNSYQMSTIPNFNSQGSFNTNSTSTFQNYNSYTMTGIAPTLKSQGSFAFWSTSSFQDHNSYDQMSTKPCLNSQGSFTFSSTSAFQDHHNSHQKSTTSDFHGHNSYFTSTEPTFQGHHHSYTTSTMPNFHSHNSYQMGAQPSSRGNHLNETSIDPNFHSHNYFQTSTQLSMQASTKPISHGMNELGFHGQNSFQNSLAPTFQDHNTYQKSIEPTSFHRHGLSQMSSKSSNSYQASAKPTFRMQNSNMLMVEATPSQGTKNPNEAMVSSFFWGQNFHDTRVAPTFNSTRVSNDSMVGAPKEDDDIFGSWPSALTNNEHAVKKSIQGQSLLQQQQTWLEQQKKIISKHMI